MYVYCIIYIYLIIFVNIIFVLIYICFLYLCEHNPFNADIGPVISLEFYRYDIRLTMITEYIY